MDDNHAHSIPSSRNLDAVHSSVKPGRSRAFMGTPHEDTEATDLDDQTPLRLRPDDIVIVCLLSGLLPGAVQKPIDLIDLLSDDIIEQQTHTLINKAAVRVHTFRSSRILDPRGPLGSSLVITDQFKPRHDHVQHAQAITRAATKQGTTVQAFIIDTSIKHQIFFQRLSEYSKPLRAVIGSVPAHVLYACGPKEPSTHLVMHHDVDKPCQEDCSSLNSGLPYQYTRSLCDKNSITEWTHSNYPTDAKEAWRTLRFIATLEPLPFLQQKYAPQSTDPLRPSFNKNALLQVAKRLYTLV